MTTSQTKDQLHLAALLAREIPTAAPHWIADATLALHRLGRKATRSAVRYCNGEISEEQSDKDEARVAKAAVAALLTLFVVDGVRPDTLPDGWGVKIGGDPRGYCLRLLTPSKAHNTWGGESDGWGIG